MIDGLKKEIDYLRDIKIQFWTAFLGSFSGSFGLIIININPLFKWFAVTMGFSLSALFLKNYFQKGDMIERRINYLKKKGE